MPRQPVSESELALLCLAFVIPSEVEESLDILEKCKRCLDFARYDGKGQFRVSDSHFGVRRRLARVAKPEFSPDSGGIFFSSDIAGRICRASARSRANAFGFTREKRAHQLRSAAIGRNDQPRHFRCERQTGARPASGIESERIYNRRRRAGNSMGREKRQ